MEKKFVRVSKEKVDALADSIRNKAGLIDKMTFDKMKEIVDGISGGGGSVSVFSNKEVINLTNIKTLPNTGNITTIYFNTKLTNDEVVNILNQIPNEAYLDLGASYIIYPIASSAIGDLLCIKYEDKENDILVYMIQLGDDQIGYFGSKDMIEQEGATIGWQSGTILDYLDENMCFYVPLLGIEALPLNEEWNGLVSGQYNELINNFIAESWEISIEYVKEKVADLNGEYEGISLDISGDNSINTFAKLGEKKVISQINVKDLLQIKMDNSPQPHRYLFTNYEGDWNCFKNLRLGKIWYGEHMFESCYELENIPFEVNVEELRTGNYMFSNCRKLKNMPTSYPKLFEGESMFAYCEFLETFERPITYGATQIYCKQMFQGCNNLKQAIFSENILVNPSYMFSSCTNLTKVSATLYTAMQSSDLNNMFYWCVNLTDLSLKNIPKSLQVGSGTSWGHLLTLESLIGLCQECIKEDTNINTLTIGSANLEKLANVYVKLTNEAEENSNYPKLPMVQCESTDDGAMTIDEYMGLKFWELQ